MPKRSMRAAAKGAVRPKSRRLIETAAEIVPSDQPNSSCSGWISTPGVARKPAAPTRAMKATTATDQAGCKRFTSTSHRKVVRPDEWPDSHSAQESSHDREASGRPDRVGRGGAVRPGHPHAD